MKGIDELLSQLINDRRLQEEFESDRDRVLSRFDLSDLQREALKCFKVSDFVAASQAMVRPCAPAAVL